MKTVILFNTTNHHTALIHAEHCRLVAAAKKSRGLIRVIPTTAEAVSDLTERGWQVKRCKCSQGILST